MSNSFVIHIHYSSKKHWDLRLEKNDVLKSWAVPKEPPSESNIKRLAIQVEDHDLNYGSFEGVIPEGQYGAGLVEIWDEGTYTPEKWETNKIVFMVSGKKLSGRYTLIKLKKSEKNEWLLFKTKS